MPRFKFPDPSEATVGNPTFFVDSGRIMNLYNQDNPENTAIRYCKRVIDWFINEALFIGWTNAVESGNANGVFLHLKIQVINNSSNQLSSF